jgi:hypothetical protein
MGYDISIYFFGINFFTRQEFIYLEKLLQQTSTDVFDFITYTLGPTLLWNIVVSLLSIFR